MEPKKLQSIRFGGNLLQRVVGDAGGDEAGDGA